MAYADQQMSGNRVIAIIIVALIHIALGYALVTGLAYEAATKVLERVTTIDVEEPPPPPSQARSVSPDNAARWAARIQSDYPSSALRRDESGTVTMRITVGANGRVEACSVTGSSGSSALDDAACRGMQRYARYNPALNAAGNPISATTTQSIRYVLPD